MERAQQKMCGTKLFVQDSSWRGPEQMSFKNHLLDWCGSTIDKTSYTISLRSHYLI